LAGDKPDAAQAFSSVTECVCVVVTLDIALELVESLVED
jgi:hypothetical protein